MTERTHGMSDILSMDATAIIDAYRSGKLTPGKTVEAYIAHQTRFNASLNLIVEDRYDTARKEAAHYDALLAEGTMEGKLFGVPISMKEAFDMKNMHTTGGLTHNKDRIIGIDAEVVRRLQNEGAIILGKTNTPTLCFCQETDNYLFGRSNNPWNPDYTTGGSSGGEAALIAVGGAAAGSGSDIGGSIRIPVHFNGVVGFKAGAFQFPQEGHFPYPETKHQQSMLGYGPIVKSVRDAALLYSIIHPVFQPPVRWQLPEDVHVISFGSFHKTQTTDDTEHILTKAREALEDSNIKVCSGTPDFMKDVAEIWQLIMCEDRAEGAIALAYPEHPKGFIGDYLKAKLGLKAKHHPYLSWAIIGTNLFSPNEKQHRRIEDFLHEGEKIIDDLLTPRGVFVIPTYPTPAKRHGKVYGEIFSLTMSLRRVLPFVALPNVFGLPSMVVPCGMSRDGLPIGLQVISTVGNEDTLFRVAHLLESALGGYQRNTHYD